MHQCVNKSSLSHHLFIHFVFIGRPSATPFTSDQWWKITAIKVRQGRGTLRKNSLWSTSQTPYPIIAAFPLILKADPHYGTLYVHVIGTCNSVLIASFTSKHSCLYNKVFRHRVFVYLCACLSLISSTNCPAWIVKKLYHLQICKHTPLCLPTTSSHPRDLESILPD